MTITLGFPNGYTVSADTVAEVLELTTAIEGQSTDVDPCKFLEDVLCSLGVCALAVSFADGASDFTPGQFVEWLRESTKEIDEFDGIA
jgi:hypothetical protein